MMRSALPFLLLFVITIASSAAEPSAGTIPIIGIRINRNDFPVVGDVSLEHLISLSWRGLDGVDSWGWGSEVADLAGYCDSTGMLFILLPAEMGCFIDPGDEEHGLWFRWEAVSDVTSDSAFAHPVTPGWSTIDSTISGPVFYDTLPENMMILLSDRTSYMPATWCLGLWDEASTNQRAHMVMADTSSSFGEYYGYWPNMYTQARSMVGFPTMEEIEPQGVFSWLKWAYDQTEGSVPVTTTLGTLLTYDNDRYPGLPDNEDVSYGTLADMARSISAVRDMRFGNPEGGYPIANAMEFICFNRYTFRHVGMGISTTMSDSCWRYLIEMCEASMDTVVSNAGDMPVYFYAQVFGGFGGPAMREQDGDLTYPSLMYRQPSIAEVRMLCNLALLHQMKGVFPYDVRSYHEVPGDPINDWIACSLLDWNLIPFDAPYEDWVYSGRLDHDVCRPDSIPPFNGYDPLFTLPQFPQTIGEREAQDFNEWKFAPFANLWNGIRDVLAEVKVIGPEISNLWWWDDYEDAASVEDASSTIPVYVFVAPVVKVFTNAAETSCYLYYLNKQCRADDRELLVTCDEDDFPGGVLTEYVLDHHRRLIIPVTENDGVYSFVDTLEAGQGRLVQFVSGSSLQADARITEPDVWVETQSGVVRDFGFTAGDEIEISAEVFNMTTTARRNLSVTLCDITDDSTVIDTELADLPGLSLTGYETASDTLHFMWQTDSRDIGVHVLEIRVARWVGEPNTADNQARVVFQIEPRDYSTEVLQNPWDMTEATASPPAWKTTDIDSLLNWDNSGFTDSISGMFEGMITNARFF